MLFPGGKKLENALGFPGAEFVVLRPENIILAGDVGGLAKAFKFPVKGKTLPTPEFVLLTVFVAETILLLAPLPIVRPDIPAPIPETNGSS